MPLSPCTLIVEEHESVRSTAAGQFFASTGADDAGNYYSAWEAPCGDGSGTRAIYFQKSSPQGTPLGPETRMRLDRYGEQTDPDLAVAGNGSFLITCTGRDAEGRVAIRARLFDPSGAALAETLQVNTQILGDRSRSAVAVSLAGQFIVVWTRPGQGDPANVIGGQIFDAAANRIGTEFRVNTGTPSDQSKPVVNVNADGTFEVTWQSPCQDGSQGHIYGQRFAADGTRQGDEFQVNGEGGTVLSHGAPSQPEECPRQDASVRSPQVVHLDFNGANDVDYNGPVRILDVDVPAFSLEPFGLAGREQDVIDLATARAQALLADLNIRITVEPPDSGPYSTVYIGGSGDEFAPYGSFFGLAEQVDLDNLDMWDKAFVFPSAFAAPGHTADQVASAIANVIAHETGHLVGMGHTDVPGALNATTEGAWLWEPNRGFVPGNPSDGPAEADDSLAPVADGDTTGPRIVQVTPQVASPFVRVEGTGFIADGGPFYAPGTNTYYLMAYAANPAERGHVDEVLQEAAQMGLKTIRTWAFYDGSGQDALQTAPGVYNESVFQGLDYVIDKAADLGLRVLLPLVNYWSDYGGMDQYVAWDSQYGTGPETATDRDDFYTDSDTRQWYRNHVSTILNRVNTFNGSAYKDDPTIFAWELANEPRAGSDPSGNTLQNWLQDMAAYVKSIDPKHLLTTGEEGFYDQNTGDWMHNGSMGTDFIRNHQIAGIDFATAHLWPDNWSIGYNASINWFQEHITDAHNVIGKPLLLEEFGKTRGTGGTTTARDQLYQGLLDLAETSEVAGWNSWALYHDGYPDYDGYGLYCPNDTSTIGILSDAAAAANRESSPAPAISSSFTSVDITFDEPIAPASVSAANILLTGSGGNGQFGDGNDVPVVPDSVTLDADGRTAHFHLASRLQGDSYQLTLVGTSSITDVAGNRLDGEFRGRFPSGDGSPGGDFVASFTVQGFPFTIDAGGDTFLLDGLPVFLNLIGYQPLEPGQALDAQIRVARVQEDLRFLAEYTEGSQPIVLRAYAQPTALFPVRMPQEFYDGVRDLGFWIIRDIYFDPDYEATDAVDRGKARADAVLNEVLAVDGADRIFAWEIGNEFKADTPQQANALEDFLDTMCTYVKQRVAAIWPTGVSNWVTWASWPPSDPLRTDNGNPITVDSLDFYSYNAYPYWPERIRDHQPGPVTGTPYAGYLAALKERHPDQPVVISETGLPDSPNPIADQAQFHPWAPAYRRGGLSGEQVAEGLADRYWDARLSGTVAGFGLFEWNDEWHKASDPTTHNDHPEEYFGVLGFTTNPTEARLKMQQETIRELFTLTDTPGLVTVTADDSDIASNASTTVRAVLSGNVAGPVQYRWEASRGYVVGHGDTAEFYAGGLALGPATVTAVVVDADGKMSRHSAVINVQPSGSAAIDILTLGTEIASGIVRNVNLDDYRLVTYIETDQLYLQPYNDMSSVWIQADGHWWTRVWNSFGGTLIAWLVPRTWVAPTTMPQGSQPPGAVASARTGTVNDTDNDRLPDVWEPNAALGQYDDPDGDGACNIEEYYAGTNPAVSDNDSDGDQLPDNWERAFLGKLSYGTNDDPDSDGLSNLTEFGLGISPVRTAVDRDRDGLHDGWELWRLGTLDRSANDPMGAGQDLLDAYERSLTQTKIWDQLGQLVMANLDAVPHSRSIVISRDGQPVTVADQLVLSYDVDPSAGFDFRQALVIDTNGVLRLRHLDSDAAPGNEDKFGTSIKLPPGLIIDNGGTDGFFLGAQVSQINLDTTDAAAGVLRLRMRGTPVNGTGDPAPVNVEWVLTLLPPGNHVTNAQLNVRADFQQNVTLSSTRMQEAQAFQAAMFSSHNTVSSGGQTHDADQLRLTSSTGQVVRDIDLHSAPYGQLLLGAAGEVLDGGMHLNQQSPASPNGDPPNVSIRVLPSPGGPEYRGQGYITFSQDVNDDNVGAWVNRTLGSPTVNAGTILEWTLWMSASEDPMNDLPVDTTGPQVTGMTPAPGSTGTSPASVVVTFNEDLMATTVDATTVKVSSARGPDDRWGTGDDTYVAGTVTYLAATDTVTFTPTTALGSGEYALWLKGTGSITDVVGNRLDGEFPSAGGGFPSGNSTPGGDFVATFLIDGIPPAAAIVDITPTPRNTTVSQVTLVFDEPVTGLDLGDLTLKRDGGPNLLTGSETLSTSDNQTFVLGDLSGLTGQEGSYTLKLTAAGSGIRDSAGNDLSGDTSDTWTADMTAPGIASVTSDTPNGTYAQGAAVNVTVTFAESVTLVGGTLNVTLDTGDVVGIGAFGPSTTAVGTYTVGAGDRSDDLDSTAIVLTPGTTLRDAAGNDATVALPAITIRTGSDIVIKGDQYRPDALIGTSPSSLATCVGQNIQNTTGAGQTLRVETKAGKRKVFYVTIQNDGTNADHFTIKGTGGSTSVSSFLVRYYDRASGGKDITDAVVEGTYRMRSIPAGGSRVIRVDITPGKNVAAGKSRTVSVTATSYRNKAEKDVVRAIVKVMKIPSSVVIRTIVYRPRILASADPLSRSLSATTGIAWLECPSLGFTHSGRSGSVSASTWADPTEDWLGLRESLAGRPEPR